MGKGLLVICVFALLVYCLVEIVQARASQVRLLPRWLWAAVVVVPVLGPVCWLLLGRPTSSAAVEPQRTRRSARLGPEDDPRFLRDIDRRGRARDEFASWEDELRSRDGDEPGSNGENGR